MVLVEPHPSNVAVARLNTFANGGSVFVEHAAIWGGVGYAQISSRNVFGQTMTDGSTGVGQEWAITVEELASAAKAHVTRVIPRIRCEEYV